MAGYTTIEKYSHVVHKLLDTQALPHLFIINTHPQASSTGIGETVAEPEPEDEKNLCACFRELIPTLKPQYAELIEKLELSDGDPAHITEQLGINRNNLRVRRHRAGIVFSTALGLAFASDTISIPVMEIVDNAIMLVTPDAMEAGLSSVLFWGSMILSLVFAGMAAFPINRWLISRGRGTCGCA